MPQGDRQPERPGRPALLRAPELHARGRRALEAFGRDGVLRADRGLRRARADHELPHQAPAQRPDCGERLCQGRRT